jgi:hypothetical protein
VNAEPSELSERDRLERLRTFLSLLALGLFIGTCAELVLAEHYDDPIRSVRRCLEPNAPWPPCHGAPRAYAHSSWASRAPSRVTTAMRAARSSSVVA